jgi:hypothetical protein
MRNKKIELEILEANYWEHFKVASDMARVLPVGHSRRVAVEEELNSMQKRISKLKTK